MMKNGPYGRARGDFERASRAAFKTLEKAPAAGVIKSLEAVTLAADRVRFALVDELRAGGASWADIGDLFGVSRQAAHQRFGSDR